MRLRPPFRYLFGKSILLAIAVTAALIAATPSGAQSAPDKLTAKVRAAVQANTQGKVNVEQVSATPIPGIYQVSSDGEIFYIDESGRFGFVGGSLVDMKTQKDLTAAALDKAQMVPFDKLPLQFAIKEVHGKGSRKMAIFEDPNCPICRVFTKFLDQIDDVTVYRFMYPVIAPQSQSLARVAWCSSDRATAWRSIMAGARPQGNESCDTHGLVEILRLGEHYKMDNTPTVVLASGKRLVGATPPEQFLEELEQGGRQ
jgi:thiol:disulfide interchange protein DsbC